MIGSLGVAFLAGVLSTLSPCVLPLLPLVFGAAAAAERFGALALSAGVVVAYVAVGLFVALAGFSLGLDGGVFRSVAAVLLGVVGLVLLSSVAQGRLALAAGRLGAAGNSVLARLPGRGLGRQFLLGLVLGMMWSPCVGPTLGAASLLAAQGRDLGAVGLTMAVFGLGAAVPLAVVGSLSRAALRRWRGCMAQGASAGKLVLGGIAVAAALAILTGWDHRLEAALVDASPAWLSDLTTRY